MSDFIATMIRDGGFFGVAVLMFLENIFPPIPSGVVMPLAGVEAAKQGGAAMVAVFAAGGVLGYVLGSHSEAVTRWIGVLADVFVGGAILFYLYRVVTFRAEGDTNAG